MISPSVVDVTKKKKEEEEKKELTFLRWGSFTDSRCMIFIKQMNDQTSRYSLNTH